MVSPVMKITTVLVKHNKKHINILYFFFNYEMLDIYMQKTNNACMQELSCDVIKQAKALTKVSFNSRFFI